MPIRNRYLAVTVYFTILLFLSLLLFEECRVRLFMIPGAVTITYLFFVLHPSCARRMHRRKLTYEDLEDFRDADPELRRRFQIVFTRVQQIGGAICAGILVAYGWDQWHSDDDLFTTIGILGGLLSLYARIFGYIGGFCISCLYKIKKRQMYPVQTSNGQTCTTQYSKHEGKQANPNAIKPEDTKDSQEIL